MPNLIRALGFSLLFMLSPHLFAAPERLALVIGNAAYAKPLKNPGNDADAMTAALQRAGFHVTTRKDLRLGEMKSAINDFGVRLNHNTIGLIYFAGHGVQTEDNRNYLLPIGADTDVVKPAQLPDGAVSLDFIRGAMDGGGLNLIFLDACRDNPYAFTRGSGKRGLAPMTSGGNDTLIAYATAAGDTADDSDAYGDNSPYTASLIKWMAEPLPIEILLKKVRADVMRQTHGSQRPIYNPEFTQDFYFIAPTTGEGTATTPVIAQDTDAILREARAAYDRQDYDRARLLWQLLAEAGNDVAQYELGSLYSLFTRERNVAMARAWWEKAAAQGNVDAQYRLGSLYYRPPDLDVKQDYTKAREWWEKAAAQGEADASLDLGFLYYQGDGVERDFAMARAWWGKAVAQGNDDALVLLGSLYEQGKGGARDLAKARALYKKYEKAAAQEPFLKTSTRTLLIIPPEGLVTETVKQLLQDE